MKKSIKKRLLTGIATIALVAPLVLNGTEVNHIHAAQTVAPQATTGSNNQSSGNSSELNAIQSQIEAQRNSVQTAAQKAQKKFNSIPKNNKNKRKAFLKQFNKQEGPTEKKIAALQKKYINTMTPKQRKQMQDQQKAQQKKIQSQIKKINKAQVKKQQAKMLKTAQNIFVVQGKRVYTLRTDIVKNNKGQEQVEQIPGINKKYYSSLKSFRKKEITKIRKAKTIAYNASRIRNKSTRKKKMKKAQNLFMKYARVANMPTKKQQKAEAKKMAKLQKKNHRRVINGKHHKHTKRDSRHHKHSFKLAHKNSHKVHHKVHKR